MRKEWGHTYILDNVGRNSQVAEATCAKPVEMVELELGA